MKFRCISLLIATILSIIVAGQNHYYVDPVRGSDENNGITINTPFRTLHKARNAVRTINRSMIGDITVYLKGGTYQLDSTFILSKGDGGFNGYDVIYQAYDCQTPIISGGHKIADWTLYDREKNIYEATVDPVIDSRQLYVNGERAIRARSVDATGWVENDDGYDCPDQVTNWKNISNVEVVSHSVWKCHRGLIESVDNGHARMSQPYWMNLHIQYSAPPVWIENAYELLDTEGEWYLDRGKGKIYYKPKANENIFDSEIILARQENLLTFSEANNIEFKGLTFAHATWLSPNTSFGFACLQADTRLVTQKEEEFEQIPGNISLEHSNNIKISSCVFKHLGATALYVGRGCKNNSIYNNSFTDISGSAIFIGSLKDSFPSLNDQVINNTVDNNFISKAAQEFQGSVGIMVGYTVGTRIIHNEIRNLPYTAISLGWGWSNTKTVAANNEIGYNLIDSVVTVLHDGGAIYTLSDQGGTQVHHNYIKNEINDHAALYADQGSSNINFHHNVLANIFRWIDLWSTTSLNDTVAFNYYDNENNIFSGTNCIIENNVYVQNGRWPVEAIKIMEEAGRLAVDDCNHIPGNVSDIPIIVYPVPTSGLLNISMKSPILHSYRVELFDNNGRLITMVNKSSTETFAILNLKNFIPGLYFVRINIGKNTYYRKVIKM